MRTFTSSPAHQLTLRTERSSAAFLARLIATALPALLLLPASAADSLHVSMQVSNYNGFQISCFGEKDGWIDLSVSGGHAPYTYKWSNGQDQQDLSDLAAGYYKVDVIDGEENQVTLEVTLEQPLPMKLDVDVYEYPNGTNISCYDCNNGNASVVVSGGAAPFTVNWSDGPTGANRYNLGPRDYKIMVSDANACAGPSTVIYLRGPARSTWGMSGNAGTNPGPQYVGTSDNKDLVLKSNGQERLRLKADGEISLFGADTIVGPLYRDYDGVLKAGGGPTGPVFPTIPCGHRFGIQPYWRTQGNDFSNLCPTEDRPILGTLDNEDLKVVTNGVERMRILTDGKVRIGTLATEVQLNVGGNLLVDGEANGDIVTSSSDSTGSVLWARNQHAAWGLSIDTAGHGHILGDWNNPHPIMTFAYDKVGIGTENMPGNDYNLFVSKGILAEKVRVKLPSSWPDYVFADEYRLMPLPELRDYLKRNKHLPGIPSARELKKEGGIDLGQMHRDMVRTVEDQALYILELENRVGELERIVAKLAETK